MTAKQKARLERLERADQEAERVFKWHDGRARAAAERMSETAHAVYEFKKSLGLLRLPNTRETVTLANTEYIYRKLYAKPGPR